MRTLQIVLSMAIIISFGVINATENTCHLALKSNSGLVQQFNHARADIEKKVLGQSDLINKSLIALLVRGHILLSGPTGIAKTRLVNSIASVFHGEFKKEQFTVDTSPTDLKGYELLNRETKANEFIPGVLFGNFILLDEINRAQPKTQSATLSAMEENEVAVNGRVHELPDVYFVIATQNPEVQTGTFPLPEAQLDRFLFKIDVGYTDIETERNIMRLAVNEMQDRNENGKKIKNNAEQKLSLKLISEARKEVLKVNVSKDVEDYILKIVDITRSPYAYDNAHHLANSIVEGGVGPRATIYLRTASMAKAWLDGRSEVAIEDVDYVAKDVLRHRLKLKKDAILESQTIDKIIEQIQLIAKGK